MNDEQRTIQQIADLKRKLDAVIVAHNYQRPEVQDIADFVGDSLELARQCVAVEAKTIVFCGVHFMAETAAILNPERKVLLTQSEAGCPMADMIDAARVREWQQKYPAAKVVCYVNTSAEVKAESHICCTSANAIEVVNSVEADEIIFVPDQNLGQYTAAHTGKKVYPYPGYCYVHHNIRAAQITAAREQHPEAEVVVHPECRPEVTANADAVLSTSQMLRYVNQSPRQEFIIGTEVGILHRMHRDNPDKSFYIVSAESVCQDMKRTTLETVRETMASASNVIIVPEPVRVKAQQAIERMLEIV